MSIPNPFVVFNPVLFLNPVDVFVTFFDFFGFEKPGALLDAENIKQDLEQHAIDETGKLILGVAAVVVFSIVYTVTMTVLGAYNAVR